jgi:N-acetylglucosaminyl-diphospho-decaprenol L-rhamnosyltransferase
MMPPHLDIVIVNWNSGQQLQACLDALARLPRRAYNLSRVVVVDNASTDGSASALRPGSLPLEVVRNARNLGFAAACNQAALGSRSDYLLLLNPDTEVFESSIDEPIRFMESAAAANVGICGVRLVDGEGRPGPLGGRFQSLGAFAAETVGLAKLWPTTFPPLILRLDTCDAVQEIDSVTGAFFLVRTTLFAGLGGFDERFFMYLEDLDFSLRARQTGVRSVILGGVTARHIGGGSSNQVPARRLLYALRSRLAYGRKHFGFPRSLLLVLLTLLEAGPRLGWVLWRAREARTHRSVPPVRVGGALEQPADAQPAAVVGPPGARDYRRLTGNTVAAVTGRAAAILLALVLSTVLFGALGPQQFGVWSLMAYLVGYSTLVDFGLSGAVERRVARLNAVGRPGEIGLTIGHALALAVFAMCALQVIVEAALYALEARAGVPIPTAVSRGLHVMPVALFLVVASQIVGSALSGLQRMATMYAWRTTGMVVGTAAACTLALAGVRRLDALLLAYVSGAPVAALAQWRVLSRGLPAPPAKPGDLPRGRWRASVFRELLGFGGVLQMAVFGPLVGDYAFRLVVAHRFGVGDAGLYDLASRAAFGLRGIVSSLFAAVVPFGVGVIAAGQRAEMTRLLRLTVKYAALFMLPSSALLYVVSDSVMHWWLGASAEAEQVSTLLRPLLAIHAVASLTVPMAMMGRAAGVPSPEAATAWIASAVGVGVSLLAMGFTGAVVLFAAAPMAAGVVLWIWLGTRLGVGFEGTRDLVLVSAAAAAAGVAAAGVDRLALAAGTGHTGASCAALAAGTLVAASAAHLLGVVQPRERSLLLSVFDRSGRRNGDEPASPAS